LNQKNELEIENELLNSKLSEYNRKTPRNSRMQPKMMIEVKNAGNHPSKALSGEVSPKVSKNENGQQESPTELDYH
jgi:hypothetical protein